MKRMMEIDTNYLYRQDPISNLPSISREGFRCRVASDWGPNGRFRDAGEHVETETARSRGWPVPQPQHMNCPRIYVYFNWKAITETPLFTGRLRIRLSRAAPELVKNINFYPEGSFSDPRVGYVVLPNAVIGDVVILPEYIDVNWNDCWLQISEWAMQNNQLRV